MVSEPAHSRDAGSIIHGAGHRKEQLIFRNHFSNHTSLRFFFRKCELLLGSGENQGFLTLWRVIEIFCNHMVSCGGKAVPIFDAVDSIHKMKFRWVLHGIVIERKGVDRNGGTLMLGSLCIADKLYRQPKGTNHIAFAAAVFSENGGSGKQLCGGRQRNQAFLKGTQSGCLHGKRCLISKGPIVLKAKLN